MTENIPIDLSLFPILTSEEVVVVERPLGSGGFCQINPVRRLRIDSTDQQNQPSDAQPALALQASLNDGERLARQRLERRFREYEEKYYSPTRYISGGRAAAIDPTEQRPPRIAIKKVKPNLSDRRRRVGVHDLMAEVAILSKCLHPNIITLHAVGCEEGACHQISFAVLDQLRSTMRKRLYKWKEDSGIIGSAGMWSRKRIRNELWLERLVVLVKVADAIRFLHSKGIVHRDVTPDNIGFAEDNVVKLFDFGLAKSLTGLRDDDNSNGEHPTEIGDNEIFDLSSDTGTLRYMAPEIAMGMPYGLKVDVHSFSLVMFEVLSLTKPYVRVQPAMFMDIVIRDGLRPTVNASWPPKIKALLLRMWSTDNAMRPSSKEVVETLEGLLRGDDRNLYPASALDGWKNMFFETG